MSALVTRILGAAIATGAMVVAAQVPRPAQSASPRPAQSASPKPAGSGATQTPEAAPPKPGPAPAAKGPARETAVSYSVGLPQVFPPMVRLPAPEVEKLANGMSAVVVRDPGLPLVDVALIVKGGYSSDPAGKRGLTRAVAFGIRFGGTLDRTEKDVETFLVDRSLNFQVVVGPDSTQLSFRSRKEDLSDALGLLAEMLSRPAFRRGPLEAFSLQMRQAIQARGQNPDEAVAQEIEASWFGPDSSWSRRYQNSDVQAITHEAIVAHFERTVVPSRSFIGLSGDIDAGTARQLLGRTLGSWKAASSEIVPVSPLPVPARRLTVLDRPNALSARLAVALPLKQRGPQRTPAESAVLALLAAQIDAPQGSGMEAVMAPFGSGDGALRVSPGLGLSELPALRIFIPLRPREAIDGTVALWKELQRLQTEKISPAKLEAAKRTVLQRIVYQASTSSARFQLLMEAVASGLTPGYLESLQQAVLSMTPADYERLIKEQVNLDAVQLVLIGDERDYRSPPETIGFPVVRASATPPPEPPAKAADEDASRADAIRLLSEVQKAMGGAELLAGIHDATWDYEAKLVRASPPVIVTQHNSWLQPNFYRQEQASPIASGIGYYDGKVGWSHNGRNLVSPTQQMALQYRNEVIRLLFRLVLAGEREGYKVAYAGSGLIKIISPENYRVELAIDFQTNLPERLRFIEHRPGDNAAIPVEEQLSDYKRVDGVLMPHRIIVKQLGQEYADFTMKQMHFNTGLTEEQIGKKP
ncbi:MAG: pitrilysin family protein [Acidobacteriota bacterium]